jgi:histidine phosphotransfer protein HptB
LAQLTDGDEEFQQELLHLYLQNSQVLIQQLGTAIAAENWAEVMKLAHQLKGSSGNAGALRSQAYASELEQIGRQGHQELASIGLANLEREWQNLKTSIDAQTGENGL